MSRPFGRCYCQQTPCKCWRCKPENTNCYCLKVRQQKGKATIDASWCSCSCSMCQGKRRDALKEEQIRAGQEAESQLKQERIHHLIQLRAVASALLKERQKSDTMRDEPTKEELDAIINSILNEEECENNEQYFMPRQPEVPQMLPPERRCALMATTTVAATPAPWGQPTPVYLPPTAQPSIPSISPTTQVITTPALPTTCDICGRTTNASLLDGVLYVVAGVKKQCQYCPGICHV